MSKRITKFLDVFEEWLDQEIAAEVQKRFIDQHGEGMLCQAGDCLNAPTCEVVTWYQGMPWRTLVCEEHAKFLRVKGLVKL